MHKPHKIEADLETADFHEAEKKLEPLTAGALDDYSSRCAGFLHELDKELAGKRVLDVGCGRGDLVMRLRQSGVRAFGLEVEPRYVKSGRILGELYSDEFPIIGLAEGDGRFPYPDDYFDWVVSFQVLEHVRDLEPVAREMSRVLRPGGATVHILPAKYRVVEPHYSLPFVHWLPKSPVREKFISMLMRLGVRPAVLQDHDHATRTASIYRYSNEETYYRTPATIARYFRSNGLKMDGRPATKALLKSRLPKWPVPASVVSPVMNWLWTTVVCARKPPRQR
jgi:SAM-dependent methyltransferase